MNIELPDEIITVLEARVKKEKKFQSVQEYVVYLLKQVAEKLEKTTHVQFSEDEEEKVAKRLRALGYID